MPEPPLVRFGDRAMSWIGAVVFTIMLTGGTVTFGQEQPGRCDGTVQCLRSFVS